MDAVLIVEDDDPLREVLATVIERAGFSVVAVHSAEDGLRALATQKFACVLADFKLPQMHGIDFARKLRESSARIPFVIMTAYGSIDIAVEAMKCGASDFITKPIEPSAIASMLREVIQHNRIIDRSVSGRRRGGQGLITKSAAFERILVQARKVAAVDSPVLLLGESGCGKEVLARYVHDHSPRHDKPFIAVNCGAIPPDLLESEFFGHEAGAFTGATQSRVGIFELASGGTVFLDEVAEMPPNLQVKLLRVLQENEIRRVGGNKTIAVRPRIIAATNRCVETAMKEGFLREDFYYRVAVVTLSIPPLRERREDILDLARGFAQAFAAQGGRQPPLFDELVEEILQVYQWPGNVRELENVIERAVLMADDVIRPDALGIRVGLDLSLLDDAAKTLSQLASAAARQAEEEAIARALDATRGNKSKAAELLGVSYKTLLAKVREYELGGDGSQPDEASSPTKSGQS